MPGLNADLVRVDIFPILPTTVCQSRKLESAEIWTSLVNPRQKGVSSMQNLRKMKIDRSQTSFTA